MFDGYQPIDLAGPFQVFSTANDDAGIELYKMKVYAASATVCSAGDGLRIVADHLTTDPVIPQIDMLIIPGGPGANHSSIRLALVEWIVNVDNTSNRTCSVCTGAFLLAATGLLDNRKVTTHWRSAKELQKAYPLVRVEEEHIYCEDGKYWTTAGVTAGIDLGLALVERDFGSSLTQSIAKRLVVFMRRRGDQRQYSQMLLLQDKGNSVFRGLLSAIREHIADKWTVDDMANVCAMSRRNFQRKFTQQFDVSPKEALKLIREQQLLSLSDKSTRVFKKGPQLLGLPRVRNSTGS